jgi:hypothetical protein
MDVPLRVLCVSARDLPRVGVIGASPKAKLGDLCDLPVNPDSVFCFWILFRLALRSRRLSCSI